MAEKTPNFADLIHDAQRLPEPGDTRRVGDAASPFGLPLPPGHRVVDDDDATVQGKVPGAVERDYKCHVKVLNLQSPDNQREYERIIDDCMAGKGIPRFEDRHFTKEGDVLVVMSWLSYTPRAVKDDEDDEDEDGPR